MPMDLSIFKPGRADKPMQHGKVPFENHQSVMRSKDRTLAEDQILRAKEFRLGVDEKSWIDRVEQAKLCSKRAQIVLDTVKATVEKALEIGRRSGLKFT